jgi:diguanylate cyclase (GGDEF)-like protein
MSEIERFQKSDSGTSPFTIKPGLRRYLFVFFVIVIGLMAVLARTVWQSIDASTDHADAVTHTYRVQNTLKRVDGHLLAATASQRGYLLSGNRVFLAEYYRALPELQAALDELAQLVNDNPEQIQRVRRLDEVVGRRLSQLDEALEVRDQSGLAAAQLLLRQEDRRATEAELASLAAQIDHAEEGLLSERERRSAASHEHSVRIAVGTLTVSTLILVAAFAMVLRAQDRRRRAERESRRSTARLEASLTEMTQLTGDLRILTVFGERLQGCRNQEEVIDAARRTATDLLPRCAGNVYLVNSSQNHVESAGEWGAPAVMSEPVFAPDSCWCLRRGQTHEIDGSNPAQICAHIHADDLHGNATCCLPLIAQGENLGLLFLSCAGTFDDRARQLATALAEQLSLALANQKLQETLRIQSIRDPLTGLFNRRYLEASFARELTRSQRRELPLAVLMLDLDHFKRYNDEHGHDAGDQLLAGFGRLLLDGSRREDIACRYGGEEFMLVLVETSASQAVKRADEIREALAGLAVPFRRRVLRPATVSIGIAVFPELGANFDELMRRADGALYEAKKAGRDRVVSAT